MLADEPVYTDTYVSSYEIDPFAVAEDEKIDFLLGAQRPRARVEADRSRHLARRCSFASRSTSPRSPGSRITQQRVRVKGDLTAVRIDKSTGAFETMGNAAPPAGRGWEYFTTGYDWTKDADEIPALLEQKMSSPSIKPGRYDIVVDPTNLWLTIHESIGHSTELDRVLGYEANYAGTSFATLDKLNTLQFGAPMMHVTGDRQVEHGLSTVGYDDEGVAAQTWDIVRDGVLVGYQLDRQMAHKQGFGRSNGCAFADQAGHVPLQRMPNVSLSASPKTDHARTICSSGMDEGLYIVGDKSWSIDMQRYNFQFTGQKFFHDARRQDRRAGQGRRVSVAHDRLLELDGGRRRAVDLRAWRRVQLRQGAARTDCARYARMSRGAVPADQHPQHGAGGALITLQDTIDRVLRLSKADACIVIAQACRERQHPVGAQHGDDQRRCRRGAVVGDFDRRPPRRIGDAHVLSARAARGDRARVGGRVRSAVPRRPTTCR